MKTDQYHTFIYAPGGGAWTPRYPIRHFHTCETLYDAGRNLPTHQYRFGRFALDHIIISTKTDSDELDFYPDWWTNDCQMGNRYDGILICEDKNIFKRNFSRALNHILTVGEKHTYARVAKEHRELFVTEFFNAIEHIVNQMQSDNAHGIIPQQKPKFNFYFS